MLALNFDNFDDDTIMSLGIKNKTNFLKTCKNNNNKLKFACVFFRHFSGKFRCFIIVFNYSTERQHTNVFRHTVVRHTSSLNMSLSDAEPQHNEN